MGRFTWFENRRIRRVFEGHFSPDVVQKVLDASDLELDEFQNAVITLFLIQIRDDDLDSAPPMIAQSSDLLMQHGLIIQTIISSMIVAYIGPPLPPKENSLQICEETAAALLENLSGKVKILYGDVPGKIGLLGNKIRCSYSPLITDFSAILRQLADLEFGNTKRIEVR